MAEGVSPLPTVRMRRLDEGSVAPAADVLATAFDEAAYPWTRWTVAADGHRDRLRGMFHDLLQEVALPYAYADIAEAGSGPAGVAVWLPSEISVPAEVWQRLSDRERVLAGDRYAAAQEAEAMLEPHRPTAPHLTLATLAVSPEHQRAGAGRLLLRHGVERADALRLPCHLETSSVQNVSFYSSLGFVVTAHVELGDRLQVWLMRRAAASIPS